MSIFVGIKTISIRLSMKIHHIFAATMLLSGLNLYALDVEVTPGHLSDAVGDSNITSLTVTGAIDASDLDFVNNSLPQLLSLDLSKATIAPYSGITLSNGRSSADANTIPEYLMVGSKVKNLQLPLSLQSFSEGALAGSAIESITIPATVSVIGDYVFKDCTSLREVRFSESVTTIGKAAFEGCVSLTGITLPQSLTIIADRAFAGCSSLNSVAFGRNISSIGESAFSRCGIAEADMAPCSRLTSIAGFCFANCNRLEAVIFPASVNTLGQGAFFNATALKTITIPENVTSLADYLLKGAAEVDASKLLHNNITAIGSYALFGFSNTETLCLPDALESLGDRAMGQWTSLKSLDAGILPAVPRLGDDVWSGIDCSGISLYVPENLKSDYMATPQWNEFNVTVKSGTGVISVGHDDTESVTVGFVDRDLVVKARRPIDSVTLYDLSGRRLTVSVPGSDTAVIDTSVFNGRFFITEVILSGGNRSVHKTARTK